jgi:hypothetical protein
MCQRESTKYEPKQKHTPKDYRTIGQFEGRSGNRPRRFAFAVASACFPASVENHQFTPDVKR